MFVMNLFTSDAIGKDIPVAIETEDWYEWPEAKFNFEELKIRVGMMPKKEDAVSPDPQDLSDARILMLFQANTNGLQAQEDESDSES